MRLRRTSPIERTTLLLQKLFKNRYAFSQVQGAEVTTSFDLLEGESTWKIEHFGALPNAVGKFTESPSFHMAGHRWRMYLYPGGKDDESCGDVAAYLSLHKTVGGAPRSSQVAADQVRTLHRGSERSRGRGVRAHCSWRGQECGEAERRDATVHRG